MPNLIKSESTEHVLVIEKMIKSIDSQLTFDEKVNNATIILACKCMPTAISEEDLNTFLDFTLKAVKQIDSEISVLVPETVTSDKLEQVLLRKQILTWSTITNRLAQFYNPEYKEKIQAVELISNLKELFS